ncbi:MAG: DUF4194 domain-containing protein [Lachnospiraceae bacterium]|nr:DUF4194 domain-containing protein [Lachnospiraceae bacterium]
MELFEGMLQKDREEFRRVCNRLMSSCFIMKRSEKTKSDFYFILRHREVFDRYLDVLGYTLEVGESSGVIQLVNRENNNHVQLKLIDSIILLILRILYDEKKRELSLTDVVVNVGEIQEKYMSLKIRERQIDKTVMNNALRLFRRYNLVETLDRDLTQEDARVLIYDSIVMAVRADDIRQTMQLIDRYRRGSGENNEEIKEDSTDQLAPI